MFVTRYARWLHTGWPAGTVERLPEANEDGTTQVPGVRIVGYLGHLRTELRDEALGFGVEEVLTRGQLAASLDDVLLRGTARR
jgi:hypothetical protein